MYKRKELVLVIAFPIIVSCGAATAGPNDESERVGSYRVLEERAVLHGELIRTAVDVNTVELARLQRLEEELKAEKAKLATTDLNMDLSDIPRLLEANKNRQQKEKQLQLQFDAQVTKLLPPDKLNRLAEIMLQFKLINDPVLFLANDSQIAHELMLTKQQKSQLKTLAKKWDSTKDEPGRFELIKATVLTLSPNQRARLSQLRGKLVNVNTLNQNQLDSNKAEAFRAAFRYADKNADGTVTRTEGAKHFWSNGPFDDEADRNKDGTIDSKEAAAQIQEYVNLERKYRRAVTFAFTYPKPKQRS